MASKFSKFMNLTSISSLNSLIKCNPTSLFHGSSLFRSPSELGVMQSMTSLLSAARMSACMSTASKSSKPTSQGQSRSGRVRSAPLRSKFAKHFKGRMGGISHQGNQISFGNYALQALDHSWITSRQLEAGRKVLIQNARRNGKIWVRIFPYKPVTLRPTETRMGRGKGACAFWVAVVKPGRIIYEMGGVTEQMAREAITIASSKMPVRTKFIRLG
ncbi:50S ribosomal protein L16, chloroplastic [Heracleum sosnowskyi]|uniref:50S ribosomal protein L16, chloroplastic n=1 Tax=Heracleum sosnowskyi TaxID=360622 RepID=A0AAD8HWD8_9APIA|nr:50S ribosomal protein L16, chloroplastic [Heracleum sosnowskyi]